jgi:hypothetical protein
VGDDLTRAFIPAGTASGCDPLTGGDDQRAGARRRLAQVRKHRDAVHVEQLQAEGDDVRLGCRRGRPESASTLDRAGKARAMGVIRGLFSMIGGLLAGVLGLVKGLLQGVGNLLRRLF